MVCFALMSFSSNFCTYLKCSKNGWFVPEILPTIFTESGLKTSP